MNNPPELEEFMRNHENKILRDYIEVLQEHIVKQDNEISELKDVLALAHENESMRDSIEEVIAELAEINDNYPRPGFFERLFG